MKAFVITFFILFSLNVVSTGHAKTLLVMGDSLSASYGIPLENGWVPLLESKLVKNGYDYNVVNESIGGETTDGALRRFQTILGKSEPDIVIIELGANDGLRGFPIKIIKRNLNKLIDLGKTSGAKILLLGMHIPPNYGPLYTQKFHQNYLDLAAHNKINIVPFFLEGIATDQQYMQRDGIHPNVLGQPFLLNNVWKELESLLIQ